MHQCVVPVPTHVDESFLPTRMNSKCILKWGRAHTKSIQVVWHSFSFHASISYARILWFLWNPSLRKVSHRLERIRNSCRSEVGRIPKTSRALALSFVLCLDFIRIDVWMPLEHVVEQSITLTPTDSKNIPKCAWRIWSPFDGFGSQSFFVHQFHTHGSYAATRSQRDSKFHSVSDGFKMQAKMSKGKSICPVGTQFRFVPPFHAHGPYDAFETCRGGNLHINLDGFEMHSKMCQGEYEVHL